MYNHKNILFILDSNLLFYFKMAELSNEDLRDALRELGKNPGPVNDHTRSSYVKQYDRLISSKPESQSSNKSTAPAASGRTRAKSPSRTSTTRSRKSSQSPAREVSKPSPTPPPVRSSTRVSAGLSAMNKSTQADNDDEEEEEEVQRPSGRFSLDLNQRPLLESTRLSFGTGTAPLLSDKRFKPQTKAAIITDSGSDEEVEIIKPKPFSSASTRLAYLRRPGAVPSSQTLPSRFSGSSSYPPRVRPQKKSIIPQLKSFLQQQKTVIGAVFGLMLVILALFAAYRMLNRPETLGK